MQAGFRINRLTSSYDSEENSAKMPATLPQLIGRTAKCGCGKSVPSTSHESLFGFEYRGPASSEATDICVCGYHKVAHDPEGVKNNVYKRTVVQDGKCSGFRPRGPREHDTFYCGCRGWD
jgi:hypothetical protein